MRVVCGVEPSAGRTSVALGCFDGVHLGHAAVISRAVEMAENLVPTVFTFAQTPDTKNFGAPAKNIVTPAQKRQLLAGLGVRQLYEVDFKRISHMQAEEFVALVLHETLKARKAFCGFNYHFARGGVHDATDLKKLCRSYEIDVEIIPEVRLNGEIISSTRIKQLISDGEMQRVRQMLGRYFCIEGEIVHGQKLGRKLGTPTINQEFPESIVLPRFGVYASRVTLNGQKFFGVTNIGVKPTLGLHKLGIETWMPRYRGDELYGQFAAVELLEFIRPEETFDSLARLKQAILNDAQEAEKIYAQKKKQN